MIPSSTGKIVGRLASRWFAHLRAGEASADADTAFRRWLESDARHEQEFRRRERLWELAGDLEHDPEIASLIATTVARVHERRARRRMQRWSAAAVAAAVVMIVMVSEFWHRPPSPAPESLLATAVGEQKRLVLEDGSHVVLNTATRLRVRFTARTREVRLEQGEATFSVRRDAGRPFEVASGSTTARALGTQFNVQYIDDEVEVSVLEGRVRVAAYGGPSAGGDVVLGAGQAVRSRPARGLMPLKAANLTRIAAWQSQRIELDDVSVAEAVDEYNRYNLTQIVVTDPSIAQLRISGVFRTGDVQGFTNALHRAFGIRHTTQDGQLLLLPPDPAHSRGACSSTAWSCRSGLPQ